MKKEDPSFPPIQQAVMIISASTIRLEEDYDEPGERV
jgi:hypothetical protein